MTLAGFVIAYRTTEFFFASFFVEVEVEVRIVIQGNKLLSLKQLQTFSFDIVSPASHWSMNVRFSDDLNSNSTEA